jgi:hypothetical protein
MRRTIAVAALIAAALSGLSREAAAKEVEVKRIGANKIIAVENADKSLHRCLAQFDSPSGMLRIHKFPSGIWHVSVPALGSPASSKVTASARLNQLAEPKFVLDVDAAGQRAGVEIPPRWLEELRRGGTLSMGYNWKTSTWTLADAATSIGAVEDCVRARAKPARPAPVADAKAPVCAGIAGQYNGGASTITVGAGNAVRVTVGPNRPAGTGTCNGNRLSVNFPDDRLITGTFNGQTIAWDNKTTWTLDRPAAAAGTGPVALIQGLYRDGGKSLGDKVARERFLSSRLIQLIVADERKSAQAKEPGKIDYDLLTGAQDAVKFGDLQVTEASRRNDRATVRATFRNTAFGNSPPPKVETVTFELQETAAGWRITNIKYGPNQSLLGSLRPEAPTTTAGVPPPGALTAASFKPITQQERNPQGKTTPCGFTMYRENIHKGKAVDAFGEIDFLGPKRMATFKIDGKLASVQAAQLADKSTYWVGTVAGHEVRVVKGKEDKAKSGVGGARYGDGRIEWKGASQGSMPMYWSEGC